MKSEISEESFSWDYFLFVPTLSIVYSIDFQVIGKGLANLILENTTEVIKISPLGTEIQIFLDP